MHAILYNMPQPFMIRLNIIGVTLREFVVAMPQSIVQYT